MEWKNSTSYSRGDDKKTMEPSAWSLALGDDRFKPTISLHRSIYQAPDVWLVSFTDLNIRNRVLGSKDVDDAKAEAVQVVKDRVKEVAALLASVPKKKARKKSAKKTKKKVVKS